MVWLSQAAAESKTRQDEHNQWIAERQTKRAQGEEVEEADESDLPAFSQRFPRVEDHMLSFEIISISATDETELPWEVQRLALMAVAPHPAMGGIKEKLGEDMAAEWHSFVKAYYGLLSPFQTYIYASPKEETHED